jgi:hypothetical protein
VIGGTKFGYMCIVSWLIECANLQSQQAYHYEHGVDATLTNGWSTISQYKYRQPLQIRLSYTTNSVIAPSRRWTCMSAAAGSSQPSSLERAIVALLLVMSIGIVTNHGCSSEELLAGLGGPSGTFALALILSSTRSLLRWK